MLKTIGLALVMISGAGLGYSAGREYMLREKNLRQLFLLTVYLRGEIRCGNSSLPEAFGEISMRLDNNWGKLSKKISEELKSVEGMSLEALLSGKFCPEIRQLHFTAEEVQLMISLGSRLGYLDREMQLRQLELYEEELKQHIHELHEKIPEKRKICQSLGIMGGFLLAVMLW